MGSCWRISFRAPGLLGNYRSRIACFVLASCSARESIGYLHECSYSLTLLLSQSVSLTLGVRELSMQSPDRVAVQ